MDAQLVKELQSNTINKPWSWKPYRAPCHEPCKYGFDVSYNKRVGAGVTQHNE